MVDVPRRWDEKNKPIAWFRFYKVHRREETCDDGCVIHNRTNHHMMFWPLKWRADRGIFERVCPCGVGHPDPDQGPYWKANDQDWQWVHGCCGCCRDN